MAGFQSAEIHTTKPLTNNEDKEAILVKLADVEPFGNEWSDSATQEIKKYMLSETSLKMVIQRTSPLEVALFEVGPAADLCINALLVQKNLASSTGVLIIEWRHAEEVKEDDVGFMFLKQGIVDFDTENSKSEEIIGIKHPVDVVLVESPDLIYIKFHLNREKEQQLHTELQVHYANQKETKDIWDINERCVIHDRKCNEYCRGTIIGKEANMFEVYLTDKARESFVGKDQLFLFTDYFNQYHDMVFKCHLADIQPAGDKKTWSHMAVEYLQHIFRNHKNIYIKKIENGEGASLPVEMWYSTLVVGTALEPSHLQYHSVNKVLLNKGIALKRRVIVNADKKSTDSVAANIIKQKPTQPDDRCDQTCPELPTPVELKKTEHDNPKLSCDWNDLVNATEELTDWLPPLRPTKTEFEAVITCADNDGILFLHDVELDSAYSSMENNLTKWFNDFRADAPSKSQWTAGDLCTICYENKWYRCVVSEVKNSNTVNVVMIDFGSDHDVAPTDLVPTVVYTDIPAFALKVKLNCVYAKTGVWSLADYKCLLDNTPDRAKVIIQNSLQCELPLVDVFSSDGICLNDILVKLSPNLTRLQRLEAPSDCTSEHISNPKPESTKSLMEIESLSFCDLEDKELNSFNIAPIPKPDASGILRVNIINVVNISEIVVDVLGESTEYTELFDAISDDIQKCSRNQPSLKKIEVGTPCISSFSEDDKWYRATIYNIDELEIGNVLVFFVDYGNIDCARYSDLRVMKPEWFALPIRNQFAHIPIQLNCQDKKDEVSQCMLRLQGHMTAIKVTSENPFTVHVYNKNESQYHYQDLLDAGIISLI